MAAVKKNLLIEKGETFRGRLTWLAKSGKPVDLTGYAARLEFRLAKTDVSPVFSMTTVNGRITLSAKGVIDLFISDEDTATITFEKAFYKLVLDAPNGDKYRLMEGSGTVTL